jgi:hypothetical protein
MGAPYGRADGTARENKHQTEALNRAA